MGHVTNGYAMYVELRRHCNHLTPQLKLEMQQKLMTLRQTQNEMASHYIARFKKLLIAGLQVEAFELTNKQQVDLAATGFSQTLKRSTLVDFSFPLTSISLR